MTVVAYSWWNRIIPIPTDICHWSDHCTLWAFLPPLYLPVWKQTWRRKARPPFFLRLDWQDVKFDMILQCQSPIPIPSHSVPGQSTFFASCQSSPVFRSSSPFRECKMRYCGIFLCKGGNPYYIISYHYQSSFASPALTFSPHHLIDILIIAMWFMFTEWSGGLLHS